MKKIFIIFFLITNFISSYSIENNEIDSKLEKYNEYKRLVNENREKEIQKIFLHHKRWKFIIHKKN